MSLDGLRAWIGEVERKLGVRTKVMLALAAIAIGVGGAAIYLAIDTRESAVSEGDVRELQQQLEAQIGTGGGTELATLEAELAALRAQVKQLQDDGGSGANDKGGGSDGGGTSGRGGADGTQEIIPQPGESGEPEK